MDFLLSSATIALSTLLSRVFGLIRDIFFAKYLGTGMASDVFFTAYRLPNFFRTLFAEGAFSAAFVPILSSYMVDRSREETKEFLKNMFSLLLYSILLFTVLIELLMPQIVSIIASGFSTDTEKYQLAVSLSRITFPYLIFISLSSFMSGVLHAHEKFLVVAMNPVLLNLVFILSSLLSHLFGKNVSHVLSYAVLVGGALQFMFVFLAVVGQGIVLYPAGIKIDQTTRRFAKSFSSALMSSGIDQINSIVSLIMLSRMAGAISHVYYADRLVQLPTSLVGTAIGVSILPLLSRRLGQNDSEKFVIQENALLVALFLALPSMIYLYKLSHIFVPILFERGEFTAASSAAVVGCARIYAGALPAFILSKILQSIFFSNGDTKTPMISAMISLVSNVVLALILTGYMGYRGIILASVLSAYLDFASLLLILLARKQLVLSERFVLGSAKIVYALVPMVLVLLVCEKFIPSGRMIAPGFVKLVITVFLSGMVYLTVSYLTGVFRLRKYAPSNS
ncbi:MAG: murein biosynthesis integral membrane protein MurJ [Rickettsiales bacterium]|jgi:putative peptidoglycan lipid II flippase|nr:murein biosynthesis integral membrane protein MurJ [Rickettsiales bacterium]